MKDSLDKLPAKISLRDLKIGVSYDFSLDQEADWLFNLLIEMCENSDLDHNEIEQQAKVSLDGVVQKGHSAQYGEYLLFDAQFEANYFTTSISTSNPLEKELSVSISACFIDESFAKDHDEETELYLNQKMYELYFLKQQKADLSEMVHEQVYLNYDFYPKEED